MIRDFDELLAHFSPAELAEGLGVPYTTAASMRDRGSVAPKHWPALIRLARTMSLTITADMLAQFYEQRKPRSWRERVA